MSVTLSCYKSAGPRLLLIRDRGSQLMRIVKVILYFVGAAALLIAAWLMPAYLRAVDAEVLRLAGRDSVSLVDRGLTMLELEQVGPAQLISIAATRIGVARASFLAEQLAAYAAAQPALAQRGGTDPYLQHILTREARIDLSPATNALAMFLPRESRVALLDALAASRRPGLQQILRNRELTNTVHLPAVASPAGQPLEAAILMAGLLQQTDQLSNRLREEVELAAAVANQGEGSQRVELFYLDLLSLGRRLNWVQMSALIRRLDSLAEVEQTVDLIHRSEEQLPSLYAAMMFAASGSTVISYLEELGIDSLTDLEYAMGQGGSAFEYLLKRQVEVEHVPQRAVLTAHAPFDALFFGFVGMSAQVPSAGVYFKYLFVLLGGFLLVRGATQLLPRATELEQSLQLRQFGLARQGVVAVTLFLLIMAAGEPHLVDTRQPDEPLPRWKFPTADATLVASVTQPIETIMNQLTIASLVAFLAIQAIIYVICLLRLAEIRKQPISSDLKLRLLDNEENMFDAGLYIGIGGTVLSLITLALKVIQPSLMAAYASTLFGIIFVAILKICHVRPYRRRLILETEFKS